MGKGEPVDVWFVCYNTRRRYGWHEWITRQPWRTNLSQTPEGLRREKVIHILASQPVVGKCAIPGVSGSVNFALLCRGKESVSDVLLCYWRCQDILRLTKLLARTSISCRAPRWLLRILTIVANWENMLVLSSQVSHSEGNLPDPQNH